MITELLPLTKNKLEILKEIYEKGETHLLEISKNLKTHPYSTKKTLDSLKFLLTEKQVGKTKSVSLNKNLSSYNQLISLIEEYRLKTKDQNLNLILKNIKNLFNEENILICCLFGSYAKQSYNADSDIDLLIVIERKNKEISKKIDQLSSILTKEISPLILSKEKFKEAVANKEPAIISLKKPAQRRVIRGSDNLINWLGVD